MRARWIAVVAAALAFGLVGGVALAQQATWNRPGDQVQTLEDADRAIEWWRGGPGNPATRAPASDGDLWLAFGQIADDMMELDLRTRSPLYRRSDAAIMGANELVRGLRAFCDPGDYAVSGGWSIDSPDGADVTGDVVVTGTFPSPVSLGTDESWDVNFVQTDPPLEHRVRVAAYATCWDLVD